MRVDNITFRRLQVSTLDRDVELFLTLGKRASVGTNQNPSARRPRYFPPIRGHAEFVGSGSFRQELLAGLLIRPGNANELALLQHNFPLDGCSADRPRVAL